MADTSPSPASSPPEQDPTPGIAESSDCSIILPPPRARVHNPSPRHAWHRARHIRLAPLPRLQSRPAARRSGRPARATSARSSSGGATLPALLTPAEQQQEPPCLLPRLPRVPRLDTIFLRRMSLAAMVGRRESLSEIRDSNPDLALSGDIISATFNIPHSLKYRKGGDWGPLNPPCPCLPCLADLPGQVLNPRRGQSALFDSFAFLSSNEAPWEPHGCRLDGRDRASPQCHLPARHASGHHDPPRASESPLCAHSPRRPEPAGSCGGGGAGRRRPVDPARGPGASRVPAGPRQADKDGARLARRRQRGAPTRASCSRDQGRWRRFAEHELYSLFHYRQHGPTDGRNERIQWADYYPHEPEVRQPDHRDLQARRHRRGPRLLSDAAPQHAPPALPAHVHLLLPALALPEQRVPALPASAARRCSRACWAPT